jgi:hypothetical protein
MLEEGLGIKIGIGIAKRFTGGVVKVVQQVLPIDEGDGTIDEGLRRLFSRP